jgi:hypothetical protein
MDDYHLIDIANLKKEKMVRLVVSFIFLFYKIVNLFSSKTPIKKKLYSNFFGGNITTIHHAQRSLLDDPTFFF